MNQLIEQAHTTIKVTLKEQLESNIIFQGRPALRIAVTELPSINDYLGTHQHFGAAQGFIKKWREAGKKWALAEAEKQGHAILRWDLHGASEKGRPTVEHHAKLQQPVFTRCRLVLMYWRPDRRRYDVFSPFIKAVVDGFVDAGLVEDDDQTRIYSVQTVFMGYDATLKLSKEAQAARKVKRIGRKKSLLTPARYYFDFHGA